MKFEHSVRYDAPLAHVYTMLSAPSFREKATVPPIGDKFVGLIAGTLRTGWDTEQRVGSAWLAEVR